jgi:ribose 5-phosphate isomerase RpiB
LNKENFFDRLVFAFEYNNDELKERILDFLSKNKDGIFMSMLASGEWFDFSADNQELAKEIVETIAEQLGILY